MKVQFDKDYDTYEITCITYCEDGDTRVEYKNLSNNADDYYIFDGYLSFIQIIERLSQIIA